MSWTDQNMWKRFHFLKIVLSLISQIFSPSSRQRPLVVKSILGNYSPMCWSLFSNILIIIKMRTEHISAENDSRRCYRFCQKINPFVDFHIYSLRGYTIPILVLHNVTLKRTILPLADDVQVANSSNEIFREIDFSSTQKNRWINASL